MLVKGHSEIMQEAFQSLLDDDKEDDLNRMYNLLSRIPDGLNPLRDRFETHVKKAGLRAVEVIIGAGDKGTDVDPKAYVDALLEVHGKNDETVAKAFKTEAGFVASLDKVCARAHCSLAVGRPADIRTGLSRVCQPEQGHGHQLVQVPSAALAVRRCPAAEDEQGGRRGGRHGAVAQPHGPSARCTTRRR